MTVMMYSSAIHDAIKTGDRARMESVLAQAKKLHEEQGDLPKAIKELEDALKKLKG